MTELIFATEERKGSGTGSSRAIRRDGKIPAVVYGFNENYSISIDYKEFLKEYHKSNLLSKLYDMQVGKKKLKVIPREVQIDPVSDNPIHIDFQLIKEDVPVKISVRVKVINQDKSPGIKRGGVLNIVKRIIRLNCIPKKIPEFLEVDVSGFEIGQNVHISDLKLEDGVVPIAHDNFTIVTIASGRTEEKEDEVVQEATAVRDDITEKEASTKKEN
jgi:large subunit ribosomal protein L25